MKTPDEIKKGLACSEKRYCIYESCPYYSIDDLFECLEKSREDALAYIQQLERERDAAVNDLYLAGSEQGTFCDICRFKDNGCDERKATEMYCWEWRGVQNDG